MYRLIVESLLGLKLETDKLFIEPCIPSDWTSYNIHYRYRETMYRIRVIQLHEGNSKQTLVVDGVICPDGFISLVDDRQEHLVEIKLYRENA